MPHDTSHNNLEKLQIFQLIYLARFVVTENYKHHTNGATQLDINTEINSIFKEELNYFENSLVFVSREFDKSIRGSIRVLRWNYLDTLPIQKIFNINPIGYRGGKHQEPVWHIGRFAIRKGVRDINLLKQLIVCAIAPICNNENAIAYAECDSKLLRVLLAMGIEAHSIDKSIHYLGSETIPVCMTCDGLIEFYHKNKSLVPKKFLKKVIDRNHQKV